MKQKISYIEAAAALRPFFFAVHPDFFGRYPYYKSINENSLKLFNSHVDTLFNAPSFRGPDRKRLKFFIRPECIIKNNNLQSENQFKSIEINLEYHDAVKLIHHVLDTCGLPKNHHVKSMIEKIDNYPENPGLSMEETEISNEFLKEFLQKGAASVKRSRKRVSLEEILTKLVLESNKIEKVHKEFEKDVNSRIFDLKDRFKIESIDWKSSWSKEYFRSYLISLQTLLDSSTKFTENTKFWKIGFGHKTFINAHGYLILNVQETPDEWAQMLDQLKYSLHFLLKIEPLKTTISQFLYNAKITTLSDEPFSRFKKNLEQLYQAVKQKNFENVKCNMADHIVNLIDSNNSGYEQAFLDEKGHFLIPISIFPDQMRQFLMENRNLALEARLNYVKTQEQIKMIVKETKEKLSLSKLDFDSTLKKEDLILCLRNLMQNSDHFSVLSCKSIFIGRGCKVDVDFDGSIHVPVDFCANGYF